MTWTNLSPGNTIVMWIVLVIVVLTPILCALIHSLTKFIWQPLLVIMTIIATFLTFGVGVSNAAYQEETKKDRIAYEQIDVLTEKYDLRDVRYDQWSDGTLQRIYFTEPDGDSCDGLVDHNVIYDVTCKDVYKPATE